MLYYPILCYAILYYAILYSVLYCTMTYYTILCYTYFTLCYTMIYYAMLLSQHHHYSSISLSYWYMYAMVYDTDHASAQCITISIGVVSLILTHILWLLMWYNIMFDLCITIRTFITVALLLSNTRTIIGVNNDQFDLFLWEVFTTKPHYTQRELTYLGAYQYNMRFLTPYLS